MLQTLGPRFCAGSLIALKSGFEALKKRWGPRSTPVADELKIRSRPAAEMGLAGLHDDDLDHDIRGAGEVFNHVAL